MHYIYLISNSINHKIYIGQTNNAKDRWSQHKGLARRLPKQAQYIHHAMAKHGIESFSFEVLATCLTQHEANNIEERLIVLTQSNVPGMGYNLKHGGNASPHSESTKKKISEANKGQIPWIKGGNHSPETIEKLKELAKSRGNNGNNSTSFKTGHKLSEESRKKLSESLKGKTAWNKGIPTEEQPLYGRARPDSRTLSDEKVAAIKSEVGLGATAIAKKYEVSRGVIRDILTGRTYR